MEHHNSSMTYTDHHSRQRMIPWLESRIESGEIPGLNWINKQEKTFRVPWKHVGNRDWSEADSMIFKEWAVHTGRYREGVDKADWPTWKTRFRCALNRLPNIQEVKDLNRLDGNDPYKVYRFVNSRVEEPHVSNGFGHQVEPESRPVIINREIKHEPCEVVIQQEIPPDLNNIDSGDLIHVRSGSMPDDFRLSTSISDMDTSEKSLSPESDIEIALPHHQEMNSIERIAAKSFSDIGADIPQELSTISSSTSLASNGDDNSLYLSAHYRNQVIFEHECKRPDGCRVFHDSGQDLNGQLPQEVNEGMFGPPNAEQICLPECNTPNVAQNHSTQMLLKVADRGLLLRIEGNDIVATRKCRCAIFVSSPSIDSRKTFKLVRDQPVKIYDYENYFLPAFQRYLQKANEVKPSTDVVISFGQKFDLLTEDRANLLISLTVYHTKAHRQLTTVSCHSPITPTIEVSKSDEYDKYLDDMKRVTLYEHTQPHLPTNGYN
ncbi:hypothetical protein CHS0354_024676 [Potamilus streckersoni]|uniref:IRF tryptophan pentad repeat domain-containing protein n=1 Tax=Potamilus streckersoni TaxID=2493646 RepID=A0AAE0VKP3_9BIVA|nr:hypothetical protein CHS0354_024676 [Potamilus streckersoni]